MAVWISWAFLPALAISPISLSLAGLLGQLGSVFTQVAREPRPQPQSHSLSFITFITAYFWPSVMPTKVGAGISPDWIARAVSDSGAPPTWPRVVPPPAEGPPE